MYILITLKSFLFTCLYLLFITEGVLAGPLSEKIKKWDIQLVGQLIDLGNDIDRLDEQGNSALHFSARTNNIALIDQLLKLGASVELENQKGYTPLLLAAGEDHADAVERIIQLGANVNRQDTKDGLTALHLAAGNGQKNAVERLVLLGAKINLKDPEGNTALFYTSANGKVEMVELLLILGADPDVENDYMTALHAAIWNEYTETVKKLVAFGANTELKTDRDETALMLANEKPENREIIDILSNPNAVRDLKQLEISRTQYAAKFAAWRVLRAPQDLKAQQCLVELATLSDRGPAKELVKELIGSTGYDLFTLSSRQPISGSMIVSGCLKHLKAIYENRKLAESIVDQRIIQLGG